MKYYMLTYEYINRETDSVQYGYSFCKGDPFEEAKRLYAHNKTDEYYKGYHVIAVMEITKEQYKDQHDKME